MHCKLRALWGLFHSVRRNILCADISVGYDPFLLQNVELNGRHRAGELNTDHTSILTTFRTL